VFGFRPESVFAFTPESCSESARNAVRLHPGTLFAFARNPQLRAESQLSELVLGSSAKERVPLAGAMEVRESDKKPRPVP
jgi:hypothetical protein